VRRIQDRDAQPHEITNRRPLTPAQKADFERQYNAKVKDQAFLSRWRSVTASIAIDKAKSRRSMRACQNLPMRS